MDSEEKIFKDLDKEIGNSKISKIYSRKDCSFIIIFFIKI